MGLPEPGTFPNSNIILLLWYVYAICVREEFRAPGLEAGKPNLHFAFWRLFVGKNTDFEHNTKSVLLRQMLEGNSKS